MRVVYQIYKLKGFDAYGGRLSDRILQPVESPDSMASPAVIEFENEEDAEYWLSSHLGYDNYVILKVYKR